VSDWLQEVAWTDQAELPQAAAAMVECGVVLSGEDWRTLGTKSRAAILVARRAVSLSLRAEALDAAGQDLAAARLRAPLDGGREAARLLAQAAAHGLAARMRERSGG